MNSLPETSRYSATAKFLHWMIALLVVAQFVFIFTAEELPRGDLRTLLMRLHISSGFTILLLASWRVIYRFISPPPAPEPGQPRAVQIAASVTHWVMYVLIFASPITGWMLIGTGGGMINWFWLVKIPNIVAENEAFHEQLEEVHEILGIALLFIASAHLLAALWHHFVRKDDTLKRMLPGG